MKILEFKDNIAERKLAQKVILAVLDGVIDRLKFYKEAQSCVDELILLRDKWEICYEDQHR